MKPFFGGLLVSFSILLCCMAADTSSPVQDYAFFHALSAGRTIQQWQIDLNHDGHSEVLLDTAPTADEVAEENVNTKNGYDPDVHGFTVYIAKPDGSGYIISTGIDDGAVFNQGVVPRIDVTQCYVGYITQLSKWGLVTSQGDFPTSGRNVIRIYAYTIDGDHLKQDLMTEYPLEQDNPIYDQYLKDDVRIQVQLQNIVL